jgi:enamine deaminase RidA (YjgF/YER057c/UK114 family)
MKNQRKNIYSSSPLEKEIAFSRACRVGNIIAVSGTAPILYGVTQHKGDLYQQTLLCFEIMKKSIEEAGARIQDVIRTRIMLTNILEWKEAARAHGEFFKGIDPACTFVEISRFIDTDWLIETEADCIIL